jgi:hypothetical protein
MSGARMCAGLQTITAGNFAGGMPRGFACLKILPLHAAWQNIRRIPMTTPTPPPLFSAQHKTDADHLRILMICHYVKAGLAVAGLGFIGLHYAMMRMMFANPKMWEGEHNSAFPMEFFEIFKWFYLVGVVYVVSLGICNLVSAGFIKARRHRMFSLVISGFNCLNMPLGTVLGVFTIIVLSRQTVQETYEK